METNKTKIIFSRGFSSEPDFDKFDTCVHRTGPIEYTIKGCCQTRTETGFVCVKLDIKGLTANHCNGCEAYEKKEENAND